MQSANLHQKINYCLVIEIGNKYWPILGGKVRILLGKVFGFKHTWFQYPELNFVFVNWTKQ